MIFHNVCIVYQFHQWRDINP